MRVEKEKAGLVNWMDGWMEIDVIKPSYIAKENRDIATTVAAASLHCGVVLLSVA